MKPSRFASYIMATQFFSFANKFMEGFPRAVLSVLPKSRKKGNEC